mmetsp:Transcript_5292/g.4017  ORF Transcript_5292/g.4017 Transcript_5292/m.4017 type:complete len:185 (+) Transcript_5292:1304-1858(+)
MPDRQMRTAFTQVLSLLSVNVVRLFAGGLHTWVVLDEVMPKKDDFKGDSTFQEDEYLLNEDDSLNQLSNIGEAKGKSVHSNFSNFGLEMAKASKYSLVVNYTDTQQSHRFMRFEVGKQNLPLVTHKVEEFTRLIYKEESGTLYHRLQEDQDITDAAGAVLSAGKGKNGSNFYTLCLICDLSKND